MLGTSPHRGILRRRVCASSGSSGFCTCGYGALEPIPDTWSPSPRAEDELALLLDVLGYDVSIKLYEGDADIALAVAERTADGDACATIVYNGRVFDELERKGGRWAPLAVLAHEVGHHVEAEASPLALNVHPWRRELAADRVSGYALARLGASLSQSQRALRLAGDPRNGPSHPSLFIRLRAVAQGWRAARRN